MRPFQLSGRGVRAGLLVAIALLAVCALVGLRGNVAAAASQRAASVDHWAAAEGDARTAVAWEPWSADARIALGVALLGEGRDADARSAFRAAIAPRLAQLGGLVRPGPRQHGQRPARRALAHAKHLDPREPQVQRPEMNLAPQPVRKPAATPVVQGKAVVWLRTRRRQR